MPPSRRPSDGSLTPSDLGPVVRELNAANAKVARACPGDRGDRQPVHTVYGGAHLFRADTARKLGAAAIAALETYAPDAETLAGALGIDVRASSAIYPRVLAKLRQEPVEDYRLDFEDGYGARPDAEEDGHARSAAEEVATGLQAGTLPASIGIRLKPMSKESHARALRTFDLFVTTLARATRGRMPPRFVITIPKLMSPGQVTAVAQVCGAIERRLKIGRGALALEIMIETPQSILAPDGSSALRALVAAGGGRVTGAHFGAYDYTALCGITAAYQSMRHDVCDFARHMMQVALAGTGVHLSDGATTVVPVAVHRDSAGHRLTDADRRENREAVHRAWKIHCDDVTHSLVHGYYQGWDLHPAQLPTRYAAIFAFFLAAGPAATVRLRNFVDQAARATRVGDVFDDAATGQGLLNFFARGISCGALTTDDVGATGLTIEEVQGRSFAKIIEARRGRG
jgi:HpcH/HpaI aldolase/citrate lyase family